MNVSMSPDIQGRLFEVIAKVLRIPVESVTVEKSFEELKIDSLEAINIVFEVEEEFGITVPDDQLAALHSIRDVVEGVEKLVAAKAAS